jgi:hypothetical protein
MPKAKKPRHLTCNRCFGRFSTSDGLDKHLQTEHRSAMYSCTAVGCFKGTSAHKFQKPETLTQHIKESHKPDTIYTCPVKTCNFEPSKLDDVAVHIHWAHSKSPSEPSQSVCLARDCDEASGFINAATWKYFRCPIWNCRKFVSGGYNIVSVHLLAHSAIELEKVQDRLAVDGYEIRYAPNEFATSNGAPHTVARKIKCPACEVQCKGDTGFRHHIETNHMLANSPGALDHFETWRKDIISWTTKENVEKSSRRPCWLERVNEHDFYQSYRSRDIIGKCSYSTCPFRMGTKGEDHPSFLRTVEEVTADLWLHRIEILRHYPQFITHPLFQEHYAETVSRQRSQQRH